MWEWGIGEVMALGGYMSVTVWNRRGHGLRWLYERGSGGIGEVSAGGGSMSVKVGE